MPRRRVEGQAIKRGGDDLWRKVNEPGPGAHYRGYVRFSHAAGHFGLSTEDQKREIQAYGIARGWICDGFDEEPARSAKYEEIERRPVFGRHIAAAERGEFTVSLCYMNDRWARNKVVAYVSLSRLRRAGIWWATTDGRWNIDRIEEDGWDVAYSVDVTMNAAYSRKVSEKTRIGKNTRAALGYHNGDLMYGYARPADPPRPDGAPYNWKPPRMPAEAHPEHFARLRQMGEWCAAGLADAEIAARCNALGWLTATAKPIGPKRKFAGLDGDGQPIYEHEQAGPRPFSKDTVRAMLIRPFPREHTPGCGKGTIIAPDGTRVMGGHPAAWPWELWHRMDEARAQRRGSRGRSSLAGTGDTRMRGEDARAWPFSGVVVCAACGGRLRAHFLNPRGTPGHRGSRPVGYGYYTDRAKERGLPCAAGGNRGVRAERLDEQFVALLAQRLPRDWRERIADAYARHESATDWTAIEMRRRALDAEAQRVKFQHKHGLVTDAELLREMDRITLALDALPAASTGDAQVAGAITAGETLASLADYWQAATPAERGELVRILLRPEGIVYDLEHSEIARLRPRPAFIAPLSLALPDWDERDGELVRGTEIRRHHRKGKTG